MGILLCLSSLVGGAQGGFVLQERFPRFNDCRAATLQEEEQCFQDTLKSLILADFHFPNSLEAKMNVVEMVLLFEVDREGRFNLLYVDSAFPELEAEIHRVFRALPQVQAATYNNTPTQMQFRMPIKFPGDWQEDNTLNATWGSEEDPLLFPEKNVKTESEYEKISSRVFVNPKSGSNLNIPLSHEVYSRFESEINALGTNFHSAVKPFSYEEVNRYYSFKEELEDLRKNAASWWGRKFWNEHLLTFQGEDYWFSVDVAGDLQLGRDFESDFNSTYNNTRAAILQGGLGNDLGFYAVVYENQGRFADYFNQYAESIRPDGGDPAIIPGRGIAKPFKDGGYDYPVAEGYLSFSPGKFFNLQFGHGKNFIGDGYRSLLLSDNTSPYPYFRLTTSFWKIKYTNTWMSLRDVRSEVTGDGSFRTKFMANHYLSYNVSKRLNIGIFESVMWENDNNRGFDLNYLNPVIFYRAIEFSTGGRAGNAIIGLSAKYKWSDQMITYSQFLIDEFSSGDIFGGKGSWKNKLGFQMGLKLFNVFSVDNLQFQMEYNQVRPYTYSHNTVTLNYGHNNQSMAHLWGANFRELLGIVRYRKDRYYGSLKAIYGLRGMDYNKEADALYYGGTIYRSEEERAFDTGVKIGQGNRSVSVFAEAEVGFIVNPATNFKFYGSFIYRNFDPDLDTPADFHNTSLWLSLGLRTDIFNWYFDY